MVNTESDIWNVRIVLELDVGVVVQEMLLCEGGLSLLLRSANLFGESCGACDDCSDNMGMSGQQDVGTVLHTVPGVTAGFAMLFCHVSTHLTWFAEFANAARLLAMLRLARVQWAIGCGKSGSVSCPGLGGVLAPLEVKQAPLEVMHICPKLMME